MAEKNGDPLALAREAQKSCEQFAELQHYLNNSLCVAGSRVGNDADEIEYEPHEIGGK